MKLLKRFTWFAFFHPKLEWLIRRIAFKLKPQTEIPMRLTHAASLAVIAAAFDYISTADAAYKALKKELDDLKENYGTHTTNEAKLQAMVEQAESDDAELDQKLSEIKSLLPGGDLTEPVEPHVEDTPVPAGAAGESGPVGSVGEKGTKGDDDSSLAGNADGSGTSTAAGDQSNPSASGGDVSTPPMEPGAPSGPGDRIVDGKVVHG